VPICGDNLKAKDAVSALCKKLAYQANDIGSLKQALKLENVNTKSFTSSSQRNRTPLSSSLANSQFFRT